MTEGALVLSSPTDLRYRGPSPTRSDATLRLHPVTAVSLSVLVHPARRAGILTSLVHYNLLTVYNHVNWVG
jgi:hypothetical protein